MLKKNIILTGISLLLLFACDEDKPARDNAVIIPNLDNHFISALLTDPSNSLWVGTDSGLYVSVQGGYQVIDLHQQIAVTALAYESASNAVWIGTEDGLLNFRLTSVETDPVQVSLENLSDSHINSIYVDPGSAKWFGTEKGITLNHAETWQKEKFKKNLTGTITPLSFEGNSINAIASWDGDYFFATNGQGLYRTSEWDESVNAFSGATPWTYPYNGSAITDTMYTVFIDSKGQQWIGGTEGLQVHAGHDPKSQNTAYYDELVNPRVHCIAEAPDGIIWVGTENGISVYNGLLWTNPEISLPDNFVTSIAFESNGAVWIGTKKGLVEIN